jgi:hypothetical protein
VLLEIIELSQPLLIIFLDAKDSSGHSICSNLCPLLCPLNRLKKRGERQPCKR